MKEQDCTFEMGMAMSSMSSSDKGCAHVWPLCPREGGIRNRQLNKVVLTRCEQLQDNSEAVRCNGSVCGGGINTNTVDADIVQR